MNFGSYINYRSWTQSTKHKTQNRYPNIINYSHYCETCKVCQPLRAFHQELLCSILCKYYCVIQWESSERIPCMASYVLLIYYQIGYDKISRKKFSLTKPLWTWDSFSSKRNELFKKNRLSLIIKIMKLSLEYE